MIQIIQVTYVRMEHCGQLDVLGRYYKYLYKKYVDMFTKIGATVVIE